MRAFIFAISLAVVIHVGLVSASASDDSATTTAAEGCPSGWTRYLDEKCYLIISSYSAYAGARQTCASKGPGATLAQVKDSQQQNFLKTFIFDQSSIELGVWIGAIRNPQSPSQFIWDSDGSPLQYSNWEYLSPSSTVGRDCVILQSQFSRRIGPNLNSSSSISEAQEGTWKDVSCNTANYFVCETEPTWSLEDVTKVLKETRRALSSTSNLLQDTVQNLQVTSRDLQETRNSLEGTERDLSDTRNRLSEETFKVQRLQNNPVPIGFLYVEFHGQQEPHSLWPGLNWRDVTSSYAGLFFRALGGDSGHFGEVQRGEAPRLEQAERSENGGGASSHIRIPQGRWSDWLDMGKAYAYTQNYIMRFYVDDAEVRPINTAIRIWKRDG